MSRPAASGTPASEGKSTFKHLLEGLTDAFSAGTPDESGDEVDTLALSGPASEAADDLARRTGDLLDALSGEEAGSAGDDVDVLAHDLTRVALDWMGAGRREDLTRLTTRLDETLRAHGVEQSPLRTSAQRERLIVKVLELGRWVHVFEQASTTIGRLSMIRGLGTPNRRKLMLWALEQEGPFSAPDAAQYTGQLYKGQRMNEALDELTKVGWLSKATQEGRGVVYAPTWDARNELLDALTKAGWLVKATDEDRGDVYAPTWDARLAADAWEELRRGGEAGSGQVPLTANYELVNGLSGVQDRGSFTVSKRTRALA